MWGRQSPPPSLLCRDAHHAYSLGHQTVLHYLPQASRWTRQLREGCLWSRGKKGTPPHLPQTGSAREYQTLKPIAHTSTSCAQAASCTPPSHHSQPPVCSSGSEQGGGPGDGWVTHGTWPAASTKWQEDRRSSPTSKREWSPCRPGCWLTPVEQADFGRQDPYLEVPGSSWGRNRGSGRVINLPKEASSSGSPTPSAFFQPGALLKMQRQDTEARKPAGQKSRYPNQTEVTQGIHNPP